MIKKVVYFSIVLLFSANSIFGQLYQKKKLPLVDLNGSYKMNHFFISPGLTFMLPNESKLLGGVDNDDINARGRLAYKFEIGEYYIFPGGGNIFNYMDYSLSYKKLSGIEIDINNTKSIFKKRYLGLNYNLNNIIQLSNTTFLQNSIGLNLDFQLFERKPTPTPNNPKRLLLSLHYKFGYGFKIQNRLFIIPSIETPILNLRTWENWKSTYGIFNSRYRPLLFSVRILWLKRPNPGDCPPVYTDPNEQKRYEQNFME